jgi:hypothetical protein
MECCICYGSDNLIKYNHCIPVFVHQKCIEEWNEDLSNCFICRNSIICRNSNIHNESNNRIQTYHNEEPINTEITCKRWIVNKIKKLFN